MQPAAPTRVIGGRYVVLAELGRGGMGIVWRAEDRVMGRHVAVKELHLPTGLSAEERRLFRDRLLREARTAGRLSDSGIVTVHDVVSENGVDHIVMELIDAPTLADVVRRNGPLDEPVALSVAGQLVAALGVAHDSGVVHRDVKPANVLLRADGRVKLTDFGIAQAADDPRLTSTGSIVGSPGYLAPERLGGANAGPASDMWALGATLYHAVAGKAPFDRESAAATIAAVLHAPIPPLRTRSVLGAVIGGLLQRSPQARLTGPQAAAMLATDQQAGFGPTAAITGPAIAPRRRGRAVGLVVAGFVLGAAAALVGLSVIAARSLPASYTYGAGGQVPVFEIVSTGCLQGQIAEGRAVPGAASVSCDQPHDAEVFATLTPFDRSTPMPYPGEVALREYGEKACTLLFGSALVGGADKDALAVVVLVPSDASFGSMSNSSFPGREVVCALQTRDGTQLTGSRLAGS
ncbi:MAG: serine/threonine protein kinase [Pseudonocardia sp.]|nr:serine/threonine protein kinase [Pseudonocardia sp.]